MRQIHLYSNFERIEEVKALSCMTQYEIKDYPLEWEQLSKLDAEIPSLVIVDRKEVSKLWDYVKGTQNRRQNVFFLVMLDTDDFAISYEASRYYSVSLLRMSAQKNEWNKRVAMCLECLKHIEQVLKDRALLEEYEFQKNHKIMELDRIKAFVFDVDGVLTDGGLLADLNGEFYRTFDSKDGFGLRMAIMHGYRLGIISGGRSESIRMRFLACGFKSEDIYLGSRDKIEDFNDFCRRNSLAPHEVMYF